MGVTVTIAIIFWLASSYIEYRIIKMWPAIKPVFDHPFGGIALSISIGIGVTAVMGPVAGAGAALGQLMGLATNKMTYEMYSSAARVSSATKDKYHAASDFLDRNKKVISSAGNTIRLGMKSVGVVFVALMFIVGLPFRLFEALQKVKVRT